MRSKEDIQEKLKKYYENKHQPEDVKRLMKYLVTHADDATVHDTLDQLYQQEEGKAPVVYVDDQQIWNKIRNKLPLGKGERNRHIGKIIQFGIAAAILLVISVSFIYQYYTMDHTASDNAHALISKHTDRGSKLTTYLPDGTKVRLNSKSRISYDEQFLTDDERIVYLKGEAFFDVEHMPSHPFKVVTGDITTTVLGTSFNINAYNNSKQVSVAVASGNVQVDNGVQSMQLQPNELASYQNNDSGTQSAIEKINIESNREDIFGWKDNILIINSLRFEQIIDKLENWYGVNFELQGANSIQGTFTHRYKNEPLEVVLEGLSFSAGFEYEIIKGDKVIIKY